MFETAVVESKVQPIRKGRYVTLPVSVALHALAIGGAIVSSAWSVSLPTNSPSQYAAFNPVAAVPVPPAEKPIRTEPRKPATQQEQPQKSIFTESQEIPKTVLTPDTIPDTIPDVVGGPGGAKEVAVGDPSLVGPGGGGGQPAGDSTGPVVVGPGSATMPVVRKRVQPVYPQILVSIGRPGSAVVECIVGRDGVIESATVVHATHELFGTAAREAVMQWKFLPGRLRGEPVATIFQLTVNFQVRR